MGETASHERCCICRRGDGWRVEFRRGRIISQKVKLMRYKARVEGVVGRNVNLLN